MQGAISDNGQRLAPYYYPCTNCCCEECGTYDKEDCDDFICWIRDYIMEEIINYSYEQQQ